jgi:hypothetical protein
MTAEPNECPYCQSRQFSEMIVHPYPYKRGPLKYPLRPTPDFVQLIRKFMCRCGNHFYFDVRLGSDMGLGTDIYYTQVFRQGWYQFRDISSPIKG